MTDNNTPTTNTVVVTASKSMVLAFLLAFLFGPLGLLYASVVGALVLLAIGIVALPLTGGLAVVFLWIASIIWAICAAAASKNAPPKTR